jgi:hypothetical protein
LTLSEVIISKPAVTEVTISWSTNRPSDALVEYGPTPDYGESSPPIQTAERAHSITLVRLTANTTYYCRAKSRDAMGNEARSDGLSFKTSQPEGIASAPPLLITGINVSNTTSGSIKITWTTDRPSTSQVEYRLPSSNKVVRGTPLDTTLLKEHRIMIHGRFEDSGYALRIKSKSEDGKEAMSDWQTLGPNPAPGARNEQVSNKSLHERNVPSGHSPCGPIFFQPNLARLSERSVCLENIAMQLQSNPRAVLMVTGHRDSSEPTHLAITRANNARDYLVNEKGIDSARIRVQINPSPSSDAKLNRSVDFLIFGTERLQF